MKKSWEFEKFPAPVPLAPLKYETACPSTYGVI